MESLRFRGLVGFGSGRFGAREERGGLDVHSDWRAVSRLALGIGMKMSVRLRR